MKRMLFTAAILFLFLTGSSQTYFSQKQEITKFNERDTSVILNRDVTLELILNGERSDIMKIYGFNHKYLAIKYNGNEDIYRIYDYENDGFRSFRGMEMDTQDLIEFEIHKRDIVPYLVLRIVKRRGEVIKETKYYL